MKRFFTYFLFQERPEDGLSRGRRGVFWLWNWGALTVASLLLGILSLLLANANYARELFFDYLKSPTLLALNLLPPVLLALLLYGLAGRSWLAYLLAAIPVLGLSFGNFYKVVFRDDPVIAADLLILGEAGTMAKHYQLFLSRKLVLTLACAVLSAVLLALFAKGRPRLPRRLIVSGTAAALCAAMIPVYGSDKIYNANTNSAHIKPWSSTQQYIARGLVYPFLHSVKDAIPHPPEGYSDREAAAMLAQYEDADIPKDRKVNIVGIMLEAFTDFSVFEQIEFQQDVYAQYHALEAESYTGNLLTNIFAGGTVYTERAFLTGMAPSDNNYRGNTSSYVWYLKSQGYQASGDHPCNDWFYNRKNINAYLGFDWYRFTENHYSALTGGDNTAGDYYFFSEITKSILEQLQDDAPLFSFSVSYQGHGPYETDVCRWGEVDDYIANNDLEPASRYILANYLGSVMSTQSFLSGLADVFRSQDEPIVLLVFGDHKPWLGNGNSVYNSLGINLAQNSEEGFYNYWSTRYLIWANDAAKEALGNEFVGEGPDVSPCFLMNVLFEQLGWKGDAYMQAVHDCWKQLPVINPVGRYLTADGELRYDLPDELLDVARRFGYLEYYRQTHFTKGNG